jgi:membrane protein implicated in regulation of membrane protease activity
MWAVYLAALVIGMGILVAQVVMGGKDAADDHGLDKDIGKPAVADDAVALFLSTRFWIFFALAFGLSGTLINAFELATPLVVALIAAGAGVGSGLFATLAFRTVKRMSTYTSAGASDAVGKTGRVLVAVAKGKVGQVRVALKGQSVDLMATTDDDEIARGADVLVEDMDGEVAHVSRRPPELE